MNLFRVVLTINWAVVVVCWSSVLKQSACWAVAGVVSLPVELTVDEPGSAFFMRPSQPWRSNRSVQEWPMVALAGARTIRATYSSAFSYKVQLPASLLRQVAAVRGVAVSSRVIDGFGDVTAHFVAETVSSDRRQLQVCLLCCYFKRLDACFCYHIPICACFVLHLFLLTACC